MSKPKYKVGDKLFLSSADTVIPVTVIDVHTTKNPANTTYTVFHEGLVPFEKEVLAEDLHDTLLKALQTALIINDDAARATCRLITEASDKLQQLHAANARMRQLLYEQQIMEYMKNKQSKQGDKMNLEITCSKCGSHNIQRIDTFWLSDTEIEVACQCNDCYASFTQHYDAKYKYTESSSDEQ